MRSSFRLPSKISLWFSEQKRKVLYGSFLLPLLLFFVIIFRFSESPSFCSLCHNMQEYVESWKTSSHNKVACLSCHRKPGFSNHLKGKGIDLQLGLTYLLIGKGVKKLHYEVDDGNCLQRGCHRIEDLKGEMVFKNIWFPHGSHLVELKRAIKLRCTSCHAQLVQGKHLTVHETNCFICHFYQAEPIEEEECISCAVGECSSCHIEAKGNIQIKGWNFNHSKYIARGVTCERCHVNVNVGDGHVPEGKCLQCHKKTEVLSVRHSSQSMHKKHVTDRKIECADCHTPIRHEIRPILTMVHSSTVCDKCHTKEMHLLPRDFYRGSGGIGVPDSPSRMYIKNIDCVACHRKGGESRGGIYTKKYVERTMGESCVACHGEGYDKTLKQWQSILSKAISEASQRISHVQEILQKMERNRVKFPEFRKAENLLNEARHNYNFVNLGKGVHNIEYAIKLLNVVNHKTEQALASINKNYKPKEFKTEMTCTTLCHVGIAGRTIPFRDTKFSHEAHVIKKKMKCMDCHSSRDDHGKTFNEVCKNCHHGKEIKKVE